MWSDFWSHFSRFALLVAVACVLVIGFAYMRSVSHSIANVNDQADSLNLVTTHEASLVDMAKMLPETQNTANPMSKACDDLKHRKWADVPEVRAQQEAETQNLLRSFGCIVAPAAPPPY